MNKVKLDKLKRTLVLYGSAAVILLVSVMVCSLCVYGLTEFKKVSRSQSDLYLAELTSSLVSSIDNSIDNSLEELISLSAVYKMGKYEYDYVDMASLHQLAQLMDFTHVAIIKPDGSAIRSDGHDDVNYKDSDLMRAFNGERVVAKRIDHDIDHDKGSTSFSFAVPIYNNGVVDEIMAACTSDEWTAELLNKSYFSGGVFINVVNSDGDFVMRSNSTYVTEVTRLDSFTGTDNLFDTLNNNAVMLDGSSVEKLRENMAKGTSAEATFYFKQDNVIRFGFMLPLEHKGLSVWLISIDKATTQHLNSLYSMVQASNIIIMLLFFMLSMSLLVLYTRIYNLAFVDPVTKGYNWLKFERQANKILKGATPNTYCFISINISEFKMINDTLGKEGGDKILRIFYECMREHLDSRYIVCRNGADRYSVLLDAVTRSELMARHQRLMDRVLKALEAEGYKSKISFSISVGAYMIDDPTLPLVLISDRANIAMRNARKTTNHHIAFGFYSDIEKEKLRLEKDMEARMVDALKNGEFEVFLQPKIDAKTDRVIGAEVLTRWHTPDDTYITPNEYIPLFEKNGFIFNLDKYVFRQLCIIISRWRDKGYKILPLSMNLSFAYLDNRNFLDPGREMLKEYNVSPKYIEMEIAESSLNRDISLILEVIADIHNTGFTCSLDDFGTSSSSMVLLKNAYMDIIKPDKSFLSSPTATNKRECAIIESMVDMSHKLGMKVCAEGVETKAQADFLKSIGCDIMQGYLFAKPMPLERFEEFAFGREDN